MGAFFAGCAGQSREKKRFPTQTLSGIGIDGGVWGRGLKKRIPGRGRKPVFPVCRCRALLIKKKNPRKGTETGARCTYVTNHARLKKRIPGRGRKHIQMQSKKISFRIKKKNPRKGTETQIDIQC